MTSADLSDQTKDFKNSKAIAVSSLLFCRKTTAEMHLLSGRFLQFFGSIMQISYCLMFLSFFL